jgi:hypothetical protein
MAIEANAKLTRAVPCDDLMNQPQTNYVDLAEFRKFSVPLCKAHKLFNKVFGIGANRTGSTSLSGALSVIGLEVAPQADGELTSVALSKGKFEGLKAYVDRYDAFQDAPFAIKSTYAQVDALFPDSRFILTVRDPDAWFASFLRHHQKALDVTPADRKPGLADFRKNDYLFTGYRQFKFETDWILEVGESLKLERDWKLAFDKDHAIAAYNRRNAEIVRYFSERPGDLLVIDVTREKTTEKIVEFLKLPRPLITAMPHLNPGSNHSP